MRDFVIVTDSGCDMTQAMVEKLGVKVAPMGITIAEKTYRHFHDFRELSLKDFYEKIRGGQIGTTSGVNVHDATNTMKECLEKGLDILYLSFSSGMSCSYQSAVIAAEELRVEYPDANIQVIDTTTGSVGLAMITYLAAKRKQLGDNIHQVAEYVRNNCQNICSYFMVDDLKYIQKTGRISHLKATVGTMLGIKPIFKLNHAGKVFDDAKVRGKKAGVKHLLTRMKEKCTNHDVFFICHADVEDEANSLKLQVLEQYPNAEVHVNCVGPILGNNTGPGALALIFYGDCR